MNQYKLPNPPEGMILNPDQKVVESIFKSLATNTEGYCPCVPKYLREGPQKEDYFCTCKEANESKICRCKLFVEAK